MADGTEERAHPVTDTDTGTGPAPLLVGASALFWGFQFAFLVPSLALLLVALFHASPADVGWVLAVTNAGGFVASLVIPGLADRRGDYLRPMFVCGLLTLALAVVLFFATTLPVAVIALVVLGSPAGVGGSMLFADIRAQRAPASTVMRTRAVMSFAWVAGPPVATVIMGAFGSRAILPVLAGIAVLNVTTSAMLIVRRRSVSEPGLKQGHEPDARPASRVAVAVLVVVFIALQATNSATVSVMSLFVTHRLGLPLIVAGIALAVAALAEIPALLFIGRLRTRWSGEVLIVIGCVAGVGYYAGMTFVSDPVSLIALQVLNAWFYATIAGVGLTLFQEVVPRPGLATGLFANTRRIGAIVSGPIIGLSAATSFGYQAVFAACAILTVVALVSMEVSRRTVVTRRQGEAAAADARLP